MNQSAKDKETPVGLGSLASNKVKTKDLCRSQVFSPKNMAKPTTLIVNKNVDREEALAGIALLNKHEQAMRRYEHKANSSDYFAKKGLKPEWKRVTRSPSTGERPYVSLIAEPGDYQYIQLKSAKFAAGVPENIASSEVISTD